MTANGCRQVAAQFGQVTTMGDRKPGPAEHGVHLAAESHRRVGLVEINI